jgi:peptide-methionine (S)-S-oxide reductase
MYTKDMVTYVLGGGCFWCLDAVYRRVKGVSKVVSGYAGGTLLDPPSYYDVASGTTGHAEVVRVTFDENIIPKEAILDIFFGIHNPTTLNQQGADIGTQYRSIMLYTDESQRDDFNEALERAANVWDEPIVTEVTELKQFYEAEEEHQDYFHKNPDVGYCQIVIEPKLTKARKAYSKWLKED